jgi:hypothetical protein
MLHAMFSNVVSVANEGVSPAGFNPSPSGFAFSWADGRAPLLTAALPVTAQTGTAPMKNKSPFLHPRVRPVAASPSQSAANARQHCRFRQYGV